MKVLAAVLFTMSLSHCFAQENVEGSWSKFEDQSPQRCKDQVTATLVQLINEPNHAFTLNKLEISDYKVNIFDNRSGVQSDELLTTGVKVETFKKKVSYMKTVETVVYYTR